MSGQEQKDELLAKVEELIGTDTVLRAYLRESVIMLLAEDLGDLRDKNRPLDGLKRTQEERAAYLHVLVQAFQNFMGQARWSILGGFDAQEHLRVKAEAQSKTKGPGIVIPGRWPPPRPS